jgi:hypothetical protein
MTNREVTSLATNLMGIYYICYGVFSFSIFMKPGSDILYEIVFDAIYLICGLILWIYSEPISKRIFPDGRVQEPLAPASSNMYEAAITILGLYILTNFIGAFATIFSSVMRDIAIGPIQNAFSYFIPFIGDLVLGLLYIIAGSWLITQSRNIANLIMKRVNIAQAEPETSSN